jgi:hypothetical protein
MSSSSITDPGVLRGAIDRSIPRMVVDPIRRIAFWTAILLPFLYVPLLATGLSSTAALIAFMLLVSVNVVALYVGQSYDGS